MSMTPDDVTVEVRETLSALKAAGISVASSSKNTKYILKQVGLDDEFDAVSDGTSIKNSKPDPEVFLKAAGIGDAAFCEKTDYPISTFTDLKDIVL